MSVWSDCDLRQERATAQVLVISRIKTSVHYWLTQITSARVCDLVALLSSTANRVFMCKAVYICHRHNPVQSPSYVKCFLIIFFIARRIRGSAGERAQ